MNNGLILVNFIVAMALGAQPGLSGGLSWETHRIHVQAGPDQEQVNAAFAFTNTAREPVTITHIRTTCGCTVAELKKRTYAPGERGAVVARFEVSNRFTTQANQISIATDSRSEPQVTLQFVVDVPEYFSVSPRLVFWRPGDALDPQTIRIAVTDDRGPQLCPAICNRSAMPMSIGR